MNVKSITAYDKRLKSLNQALSRFFVNSYSQIPYGIEKRGIFLISFILTKRPSFLRTEGIRRARARTSALTPFRSAGYPSGLTKKSITEIDETSSAALNPLPIRQPELIFGWKFDGSSPPWHRRYCPFSDSHNMTTSLKKVPDILHRCRYLFFMSSSILRARQRVNKPPSKVFRNRVSVPLMVQTPFSKRSLCNSGDFGTPTSKRNGNMGVLRQCFRPLTGILVRWHNTTHFRCSCSMRFQSPYGDFGTLTLSPGTRSQTGLTGDFFKPRAFFAFFGDPGEK